MVVDNSRLDKRLHLSIRESARRLLRCTVGKINVPNEYVDECYNLVLNVSDLQPSLVIDPVINPVQKNSLFEFYENDLKIIQLSGLEPNDLNICWVPGTLREIWTEFCRYAKALAEAGYPGCLNCGGSDAQEDWDEKSRRLEMLKK